MTFFNLLITIVIDIISGSISAYIVKLLDRKYKNDRHSPKHGH